MPPKVAPYVAGLVIFVFGVLAFMQIIPVAPPLPTQPQCPWWNPICQAQGALNYTTQTATILIIRVVLAAATILGAIVVLRIPVPWGARLLLFFGLVLLGLGFMGI